MAAITDDAPDPVPGFENLVWREPALQIPVTGGNHLPELVQRGADVGLVFAGGTFANIAEFSSLTIEQPFTTWPPRVGTPAVHATRENYSAFKVSPWFDDELLIVVDEPVAVRCGEEGARSLGFDVIKRDDLGRPIGARTVWARPSIGSNPAHGIYLVRSRRDVYGGPLRHSLEHRDAGRLDVAQEIAELPDWPELRAVLDDGSFLFAILHTPAGVKVRKGPAQSTDPPIYHEVELFRAVGGKVESCGRLRAPTESNPTAIIAAEGGGAWISFVGPRTEAVLRVDASGRAVSEPWHAPFESGFHHSRRLTSWRGGFILAAYRRHVALLASDGIRATRSTPALARDEHVFEHLSTLASPDGRSVLVARSLRGHIQVLRADFAPATSSAAAGAPSPGDLWADDLAFLEVAEATLQRIASPRRKPGTPLEIAHRGAPPQHSHAKERIVSQVRLRHVLRAISGLHCGEFSELHGDFARGRFLDDDGCGNFNLFAWNKDGLIGIGFDHELNPDAGLDEAHLTPNQYFDGLPKPLQSLLDDALRSVGRRATGGLWVTTGKKARWHQEGEFPAGFVRFTMLPEPAVFEDLGGQSWRELTDLTGAEARLAITLAAESADSPRGITAEEDAMLTARRSGEGARPPSDAARLLATVRSLASASIEWKMGEERARREIDAQEALAVRSAEARSTTRDV